MAKDNIPGDGVLHLMEAKVKYSLADPSGKVISMGDATVSQGEEELVLAPVTGAALSISLREMTSIQEMDYRIMIQIGPGGSLMLFNAGFKHEDLVRSLFRAVNELEMRDLLMSERLIKEGVTAESEMRSPSGSQALGKCEVRLYETAILIMPERSGLVRLRYRDILSAETDDYVLVVTLEHGDQLRLGRLGRELGPLQKGIVDAITDISATAQSMVRDIYPGAGTTAAVRAAQLLKDGRTARRKELEEACPGIWQALEGRLASLGLGEEYQFLRSCSKLDLMRIGLKRPLDVQQAQDYMFLITPIFSPDRGRGGNAVAFEASSQEDEGRATYFFRTWNRDEYQHLAEQRMEEEADQVCRSIVKGLEAVNFRREPIYLMDEALQSPERSHYRYAILRIPELRLLRERYIGRVVHTTIEQWKRDIASLLEFNVKQRDDSAVWKRRDEGQ